MSVPAYVKYIGLTALFLLATVNFTKTTLSILESSKRFDETKEEVQNLKGEKEMLKEELNYKTSSDYVEKEARDKLGLAKPGEEIFVTPKVLGLLSHNEDSEVTKSPPTNLKLWLNLFF